MQLVRGGQAGVYETAAYGPYYQAVIGCWEGNGHVTLLAKSVGWYKYAVLNAYYVAVQTKFTRTALIRVLDLRTGKVVRRSPTFWSDAWVSAQGAAAMFTESSAYTYVLVLWDARGIRQVLGTDTPLELNSVGFAGARLQWRLRNGRTGTVKVNVGR